MLKMNYETEELLYASQMLLRDRRKTGEASLFKGTMISPILSEEHNKTHRNSDPFQTSEKAINSNKSFIGVG